MSNNFLLLLISVLAYAFALTQKLFTTSGEILGIAFKKESFTFFKSIDLLKNQGYEFLGHILFLFVIVLPVLKYITFLANLFQITIISKKINSLILYLQKYAMVDVFVIAIILIASKNNPLFTVNIEHGTYALVLSVLASIILSISMQYKQIEN